MDYVENSQTDIYRFKQKFVENLFNAGVDDVSMDNNLQELVDDVLKISLKYDMTVRVNTEGKTYRQIFYESPIDFSNRSITPEVPISEIVIGYLEGERLLPYDFYSSHNYGFYNSYNNSWRVFDTEMKSLHAIYDEEKVKKMKQEAIANGEYNESEDGEYVPDPSTILYYTNMQDDSETAFFIKMPNTTFVKDTASDAEGAVWMGLILHEEKYYLAFMTNATHPIKLIEDASNFFYNGTKNDSGETTPGKWLEQVNNNVCFFGNEDELLSTTYDSQWVVGCFFDITEATNINNLCAYCTNLPASATRHAVFGSKYAAITAEYSFAYTKVCAKEIIEFFLKGAEDTITSIYRFQYGVDGTVSDDGDYGEYMDMDYQGANCPNLTNVTDAYVPTLQAHPCDISDWAYKVTEPISAYEYYTGLGGCSDPYNNEYKMFPSSMTSGKSEYYNYRQTNYTTNGALRYGYVSIAVPYYNAKIARPAYTTYTSNFIQKPIECRLSNISLPKCSENIKGLVGNYEGSNLTLTNINAPYWYLDGELLINTSYRVEYNLSDNTFLCVATCKKTRINVNKNDAFLTISNCTLAGINFQKYTKDAKIHDVSIWNLTISGMTASPISFANSSELWAADIDINYEPTENNVTNIQNNLDDYLFANCPYLTTLNIDITYNEERIDALTFNHAIDNDGKIRRMSSNLRIESIDTFTTILNNSDKTFFKTLFPMETATTVYDGSGVYDDNDNTLYDIGPESYKDSSGNSQGHPNEKDFEMWKQWGTMLIDITHSVVEIGLPSYSWIPDSYLHDDIRLIRSNFDDYKITGYDVDLDTSRGHITSIDRVEKFYTPIRSSGGIPVDAPFFSFGYFDSMSVGFGVLFYSIDVGSPMCHLDELYPQNNNGSCSMVNADYINGGTAYSNDYRLAYWSRYYNSANNPPKVDTSGRNYYLAPEDPAWGVEMNKTDDTDEFSSYTRYSTIKTDIDLRNNLQSHHAMHNYYRVSYDDDYTPIVFKHNYGVFVRTDTMPDPVTYLPLAWIYMHPMLWVEEPDYPIPRGGVVTSASTYATSNYNSTRYSFVTVNTPTLKSIQLTVNDFVKMDTSDRSSIEHGLDNALPSSINGTTGATARGESRIYFTSSEWKMYSYQVLNGEEPFSNANIIYEVVLDENDADYPVGAKMSGATVVSYTSIVQKTPTIVYYTWLNPDYVMESQNKSYQGVSAYIKESILLHDDGMQVYNESVADTNSIWDPILGKSRYISENDVLDAQFPSKKTVQELGDGVLVQHNRYHRSFILRD